MLSLICTTNAAFILVALLYEVKWETLKRSVTRTRQNKMACFDLSARSEKHKVCAEGF